MSKSKATKHAASPYSPESRVIVKSDGRRGTVFYPDTFDVFHPIAVRFEGGAEEQFSESDLLPEAYVDKTGEDYLKGLEPIYRDVLNAYWMFNPNGRPDWGITSQSLVSAMADKYTLGQVREACEELVRGKAMTVKDGIFYRLTPLGDAIMFNLQNQQHPTRTAVPPFSPPPGV